MKRIVTIAIGIALMLPATALASGSSTCQSYNPQLCSVNTNASTDTTSGTTATAQSTLPFTGLDIVLLAAGGGTLLGAGLVVRRLSRRLN